MAIAKPHAIMISLPHQGHINPFIYLALKLASKGFTVTFVHLDSVHHKLLSKLDGDADLFSKARSSGLDIRYATISDGLPLEFDRDLHFEDHWRVIMRDFPARVDEFVGNTIRCDPDWSYFLVTDTLYPWPSAVARKYNLVNVSFWTQTALTFALPYHWNLLQLNGHFPCKDNIEEEIDYVPGVEPINTKDLMSYMKESGLSSIVTKAMAAAFDAAKSADFILHNTVHELEPETISSLHKYKPNYAIGPLNFSKNLHSLTVANSLWSEADCTEWLRSKPPGSVLYVSFGSFIHTTRQVIGELAHGLVLSDVDFVWVIRPGILGSGDNDDVLPEGFADTVKDRGLVVPWCNQIRVLSNPAVGGFLTHCGWNSTLESMWCGVPMICYPIAYDQTTNRKLVVEKWKFGVNLCDGKGLKREEIGGKIKGFMRGGWSEALRKEAKRVKSTMEKALEFDGSSEMSFDQFVVDLKTKIDAKSMI